MSTQAVRLFVLVCALASPIAAAGQAPASQIGVSPGSAGAAASDKADALWSAARRGDVSAVRALLDEGVPVDTTFRYGTTALFYACDHGHVEVARLLLERKANPNVRDTYYNGTPLGRASSPAQTRKPGHVEIVRLLLAHGAKGSEAALLAAVRAGDEPMVAVILAHGSLDAPALSDALAASRAPAITARLEAAGAASAAADASALAGYAGAFGNGTVELSFAVRAGRLEGNRMGRVLVLRPAGPHRFTIEGAAESVTFIMDGARATAVSIEENGAATLFYRRG